MGLRINRGECPPNIYKSEVMIYSLFKPYFHWPEFRNSVEYCWRASDCVFEAADESRKQQFAATALIMGLIPLIMRDIVWPERRVVPVRKQLNWPVEILVVALGLEPLETKNVMEESKKTIPVARWA